MSQSKISREYNTQLSALSPSRRSVRQITHSMSNCHSTGKNHKPIIQQNVSYGELQIILQNVRSLKEKAGHQIKKLEEKNRKLEDEVLETKNKLEEELMRKDQKKEQNQRNKEKIIELQNELKMEKEQNKQIQEKLEYSLKQLEIELESRSSELMSLESAYDEEKNIRKSYESKYVKLTNLLSITEQQEEVEEVNTEFNGLKRLLLKYKQLQIEKQFTEKELKKEVENNNYNKQRICECTKIVETLTEENHGFLQKIESLRQEIQSLQNENKLQEQEFKENHLKIDEEIKRERKINSNLTLQISAQSEEIQRLKRNTQQAEITLNSLSEEIMFKKIVDQACNEQEDYDHIVNRVEYLEKYRNEYYYNIQKIQFLCKILDQ